VLATLLSVLLVRAAELKPCSMLKKFSSKTRVSIWCLAVYKKTLVHNTCSCCRLMIMSNTFVGNCTSAHLLKKKKISSQGMAQMNPVF